MSPELEQRLQREATEQGLNLTEYVRLVLERETNVPSPSVAFDDGPADSVALARAQGAPLAARFDDLLGDFWPEDETAEEFDAAVRAWRREGVHKKP